MSTFLLASEFSSFRKAAPMVKLKLLSKSVLPWICQIFLFSSDSFLQSLVPLRGHCLEQNDLTGIGRVNDTL